MRANDCDHRPRLLACHLLNLRKQKPSVRELTLADLQRAGSILRRCVPDLPSVYVLGSAAVSARHPDLDRQLRRSIDVDFSPIGRPALYFDSKLIDQQGGPDSDFFAENGFYLDYVAPELLRCTPHGWQERVTIIELAPGLSGHILDPHDVAYNKLWAGRPKDVSWVHGLLNSGVITLERMEELHAGNSIDRVDQEKVTLALKAVKTLLAG